MYEELYIILLYIHVPVLGLKPTFFRKGVSFILHSSYLKDSGWLNNRLNKLLGLLPVFVPEHCRVVHLVDENHQMLDASCLGQHGMFSGNYNSYHLNTPVIVRG